MTVWSSVNMVQTHYEKVIYKMRYCDTSHVAISCMIGVLQFSAYCKSWWGWALMWRGLRFRSGGLSPSYPLTFTTWVDDSHCVEDSVVSALSFMLWLDVIQPCGCRAGGRPVSSTLCWLTCSWSPASTRSTHRRQSHTRITRKFLQWQILSGDLSNALLLLI